MTNSHAKMDYALKKQHDAMGILIVLTNQMNTIANHANQVLSSKQLFYFIIFLSNIEILRYINITFYFNFSLLESALNKTHYCVWSFCFLLVFRIDTHYSCHTGECIDESKKCDNIHDCTDLSDEIGCRKFYYYYFIIFIVDYQIYVVHNFLIYLMSYS